ncbi:response regulator transcription factor [Absicoccus intestinalis]|uniref:Response regulator transcription factor n=1 Tax=Absicoccus intestinalis TaxID=2926319 RepID=A0ABU4WM02_9FIRM|nr:response regulator transcription factor [Absicoccus sp. CLA-KB-P134]MDX8417604.1 response regulator transcription factor [Absicoccus sp. CLA-KB-P134]
MPQQTILIIEDDTDILMIESTYLQSAGFQTIVRENGDHILAFMEENPCDLVLLDLMLPGMDGYAICEQIRKKYDIPVLMVTARNESLDKIRGFNFGADDYIAKPFDPMELTARVKANLRQYQRLKQTSKSSEPQAEIRIGDIRILPDSWRVFKKDTEIHLTNREFELLTFMAKNPNIVFSKEQLMEKIWKYEYVGDTSTVMVHINRIREKIEEDPKKPKILETIWGAGYRLNN